MSHELVGLTPEEVNEYYLKEDPDLAEAMSVVINA